jgi:hypothetical protein
VEDHSDERDVRRPRFKHSLRVDAQPLCSDGRGASGNIAGDGNTRSDQRFASCGCTVIRSRFP